MQRRQLQCKSGINVVRQVVSVVGGGQSVVSTAYFLFKLLQVHPEDLQQSFLLRDSLIPGQQRRQLHEAFGLNSQNQGNSHQRPLPLRQSLLPALGFRSLQVVVVIGLHHHGFTRRSKHLIKQVVLFGARKESQVILQNYIDKTNDLQSAAVLSVYLKLFLQQGRLGVRNSMTACYSRLIKQYELLLVNRDAGVSKNHFDQHCILLQVQRKKKTMNKTFAFGCLNCGNSQCLLSVVKRIANDNKQHQVRMKGNNYFSKDARSKIMYCLDCMHMLPRCAVCLRPIEVYNGYAQEIKKSMAGQKSKNGGEKMSQALVWCPKCFHGGHLGHMLKWMEGNERRCPVYNCKCRCEL